MKTSLFFLLTTVLCFGLEGQNFEFYQNSNDIVSKFKIDSNYSDAAVNLSMIGDYQRALEIWDQGQPNAGSDLTLSEKEYLKEFEIIEAREYILSQAGREKILIINEAHHQPMHRVFTKSLIQELYKKGFRYFGIEGLSNNEKVIEIMNKNKIPLIYSGYYTHEPQFGEMIREALSIGMEVFAYEAKNLENVIGNSREVQQANNIKTILARDTSAKILIHCGWNHIDENYYEGWGKQMAGVLNDIAGINPLTIDQTILSEKSQYKFDNVVWRSRKINEDAVLVKNRNKAFNGFGPKSMHDVRVYHPKTVTEYGRPNWLFTEERFPLFIEEKIDLLFPCLVFAYLEKEVSVDPNCIPVDIIELQSSDDIKRKALALKKDQKYRIILLDHNKKKQSFQIE